MSYSLLHLLVSISNGYKSKNAVVEVSWSSQKVKLLKLLIKERIIDSVSTIRGAYKGFSEKGKNKRLLISLHYSDKISNRYFNFTTISGFVPVLDNRFSAPFSKFKIFSVPSRIQHKSWKWFKDKQAWHLLYLVSTDHGFLTSRDVIKRRLGGIVFGLFYL